MKVLAINNLSFKRRLKKSEEADYQNVLKEAKAKVGNTGKSVLIIPESSLPNKTGVGNLGSKQSLEFFDFAKQYWGINEIQILPNGKYREIEGSFPFYGGSSLDLGEQTINIENYLTTEDIKKIAKQRSDTEYVDFANILKKNSTQEKILYNLHEKYINNEDFKQFKIKNKERLEPKALYNALSEIHISKNCAFWDDLDKNLFNTDIVNVTNRNSRIEEIYKLKNKSIDFYYFKQFLAEDSLKKSKDNLNNKGLKLSGDMLCGFSLDEKWANPKAFIKDTSIGWGLPALNLESPEGKDLLKRKTRFFAEHFDDIRVDAAWTYINQPNIKQGHLEDRKFFRDSILEIIENEVKKVQGSKYKPSNIMYEFSADGQNYSMLDQNGKLKDYLRNRMHIHTLDYLSENWGSNYNFTTQRSWDPDSFIIGVSNHDSSKIVYSEKQAKILSNILKMPYEQLKKEQEFKKAKFADPASARHNMIDFIEALNLEGPLINNPNKEHSYRIQVPQNYQTKYFSGLISGDAYNPMDALAKAFVSKDLDKSDPKLYKKILKYKKILEQKETQTSPIAKYAIGIACVGITLACIYSYFNKKHHSTSK